jgi:putative membrane protein
MPHMDGGWWFFGMHLFWWLFWLLIIVLLFLMLRPGSRSKIGRRETPLEVLQHRYASGELTTEEYEERKSRLQRDATANR